MNPSNFRLINGLNREDNNFKYVQRKDDLKASFFFFFCNQERALVNLVLSYMQCLARDNIETSYKQRDFTKVLCNGVYLVKHPKQNVFQGLSD